MGLANAIVRPLDRQSSSQTSGFRDADENGNFNKGRDPAMCSDIRLRALEFLRDHTIGDQNTIKALKSMVDTARSEPLSNALAHEAYLFASTWGKEPHLRALACNIKHKQ